MTSELVIEGIEVARPEGPTVCVKWPAHRIGAGALQRFIDAMLAHPPRARVILIDARHAAPVGPLAIRRAVLAESSFVRHGVRARAIVLPEVALPYARSALRLMPVRIPTQAFPEFDSARAWLAPQLAEP